MRHLYIHILLKLPANHFQIGTCRCVVWNGSEEEVKKHIAAVPDMASCVVKVDFPNGSQWCLLSCLDPGQKWTVEITCFLCLNGFDNQDDFGYNQILVLIVAICTFGFAASTHWPCMLPILHFQSTTCTISDGRCKCRLSSHVFSLNVEKTSYIFFICRIASSGRPRCYSELCIRHWACRHPRFAVGAEEGCCNQDPGLGFQLDPGLKRDLLSTSSHALESRKFQTTIRI